MTLRRIARKLVERRGEVKVFPFVPFEIGHRRQHRPHLILISRWNLIIWLGAEECFGWQRENFSIDSVRIDCTYNYADGGCNGNRRRRCCPARVKWTCARNSMEITLWNCVSLAAERSISPLSERAWQLCSSNRHYPNKILLYRITEYNSLCWLLYTSSSSPAYNIGFQFQHSIRELIAFLLSVRFGRPSAIVLSTRICTQELVDCEVKLSSLVKRAQVKLVFYLFPLSLYPCVTRFFLGCNGQCAQTQIR